MKIFLSHASKDTELAAQLAEALRSHDLTVLHPQAEIEPGENWAKKIGKALQDSDFIVFLFTPGTMKADWVVRKDVEFALGAKKYAGRVFSVFVGTARAARKEVPWILLKQRYRLVESARKFNDIAEEIESLCSEESASHA